MQKDWTLPIVVIFLCVVCGAMINSSLPVCGPAPIAPHEIRIIAVAIRQYHSALNEYPKGSNAQVAKALMGENQAKRKFLTWRANAVSSTGAFKDLWDTEYHIRVAANGMIDIRSAGPDRVFWTDDDVKLGN